MSQGKAIIGWPGSNFSIQKAHSLCEENLSSSYPLSLSFKMLISRLLAASSCRFWCASISRSLASRTWRSALSLASRWSAISCSFRYSSSSYIYRSTSMVMPCYLAAFLCLSLSFFAYLRALAFLIFSSAFLISLSSSFSFSSAFVVSIRAIFSLKSCIDLLIFFSFVSSSILRNSS